MMKRPAVTEEDKQDTPEESGKGAPDGPKEEKAIPKAQGKAKNKPATKAKAKAKPKTVMKKTKTKEDKPPAPMKKPAANKKGASSLKDKVSGWKEAT